MPLPKPNENESQSEFVSRCMSNETMNSEYTDNDQRLAVCQSLWDDKSMTVNERLLKAIKSRTHRRERFGYGIRRALDYVQTLEECIGNGACNKFACTRSASFDDVKRKAAKTLVYANEEMLVEDIPNLQKDTSGNWKKPILELGGTIPKRTLMVFKHRLTTPLQDRDGDILETSGAIPDPKMLLLWQHVHTLPIGKMLAIAEQTEKGLVVWSAIIDMNELCHDAAVMVDEDMARFSHGFRALEFEDIKGEHGFHITKFEVMEESVVSVPSNTDAEVEEVILSMVEGGKLKSGLMKQYGKQIRIARPKQISLEGLDSLTFNHQVYPMEVVANAAILGYEKGKSNENFTGNGSGTSGGKGKEATCSCGASKEANGQAKGKEAPTAGDEEVVGTKISVPEKYSSIDFSVNKGMKEEAQKGLDWREEFNRGGTQVGAKRANQIINDGELTPDVWKRVKSYFARHEVDKQGEGWSPGDDGFPSAGRIAWALWGGDAGKSRSETIVTAMNKADEEEGKSSETTNANNSEGESMTVKDKQEEMGNEDDMIDCPKCGEMMPKGGTCPECGYEDSMPEEPEEGETEGKDDEGKYWESLLKLSEIIPEDRKEGILLLSFKNGKFSSEIHGNKNSGEFPVKWLQDLGLKAGRSLSKANEMKLNDCKECLDEVVKMDMPRPCKALCKEAGGYVKEVLASLGSEDSEASTEPTAKQAMASFLALASTEERKKMKETLLGLEKIELEERIVEQYSAFRG